MVKARHIEEKKLGATTDEGRALIAFRDLTDMENPFFRYSY